MQIQNVSSSSEFKAWSEENPMRYFFVQVNGNDTFDCEKTSNSNKKLVYSADSVLSAIRIYQCVLVVRSIQATRR